jgi:cysteinyl-tRNA synthetase
MRAFAGLIALALFACSRSESANGVGPREDLDAATRDAAADDASAPPDSGDAQPSSGRGFPSSAPWVSFYGAGAGVDLARVAATFRIINIDADPTSANFTDTEITALRAGGTNRVISYMDVGSCESYRAYYSAEPPGFKSCTTSGALTTAYAGYPNEKWANLGNAEYRRLIVDYVAPRLVARGVDGFFLDNVEVVEHGAAAAEGPCDSACAQGGLDLIWALRQRYPDKLIVMQNATGDITRLGTTHGLAFPSLLDGISHEDSYTTDPGSRPEMQSWRQMGLVVNGRPFWLGIEDYVGACAASAKSQEQSIVTQALADGLSPYVTDTSAMQRAPCFWADF